MKKSKEYKLLDLIDELLKVDGMIRLHEASDKANFMASQYEAKKTKLVKQIILELTSPINNSLKDIYIIKLLLNKFYHNYKEPKEKSSTDIDYELIEKALCT
jgi:hypothetical protein